MPNIPAIAIKPHSDSVGTSTMRIGIPPPPEYPVSGKARNMKPNTRSVIIKVDTLFILHPSLVVIFLYYHMYRFLPKVLGLRTKENQRMKIKCKGKTTIL